MLRRDAGLKTDQLVWSGGSEILRRKTLRLSAVRTTWEKTRRDAALRTGSPGSAARHVTSRVKDHVVQREIPEIPG